MNIIENTIRIKIEVGEKKFSLNLKPVMFGKYSVKVGRSHSTKHGLLTITQVFDILRKWTVANASVLTRGTLRMKYKPEDQEEYEAERQEYLEDCYEKREVEWAGIEVPEQEE